MEKYPMGCLGTLIVLILTGAILIAIGELFFKFLFGAAAALVYIIAGGFVVVAIVIVLLILWVIISLFKGD